MESGAETFGGGVHEQTGSVNRRVKDCLIIGCGLSGQTAQINTGISLKNGVESDKTNEIGSAPPAISRL